MRLVFIGSSGFGLKCLKKCLDLSEVTVVGAVTAPETFSISYRPQGVTNVLHSDISEFAEAKKIPLVTIKRSMSDPLLFDAVALWRPDAFLVVGWYHMIPRQWRELAPAFGLHASLLPDYSGGAPLVWSIINGETKTGITLFRMNDGVDSGPIAGQSAVKILSDDTIATLYARIEQKGLDLICKVLPKIADASLELIEQDESKRRVMPQRCPEDGQIDWHQDAETIIRFIRAQTKPYPGAFTILDGKKLHIWSAEITYSSEPHSIGEVKQSPEGLFIVYCKKGVIALTEISFESVTYSNSELDILLGGGGQRFSIPFD